MGLAGIATRGVEGRFFSVPSGACARWSCKYSVTYEQLSFLMSCCLNAQYSDVDVSVQAAKRHLLLEKILIVIRSRRPCLCGQSANGVVLMPDYTIPLPQMAWLGGDMFLRTHRWWLEWMSMCKSTALRFAIVSVD